MRSHVRKGGSACVEFEDSDGCCCSYAVGRTTRRHPATSSRIFFPLHLFSPRSWWPVHRRTSSIHAVLLLPGKHFPSISPSIVARTTLWWWYIGLMFLRVLVRCRRVVDKRQLNDRLYCCRASDRLSHSLFGWQTLITTGLAWRYAYLIWYIKWKFFVRFYAAIFSVFVQQSLCFRPWIFQWQIR